MIEKESGLSEVDGNLLEWTYWRNGDAPTLIFLHEGLGSVSLWRDFPQDLAIATGWSAIAFSRSGYGKSDPCRLPRKSTYMHLEGEVVLPKFLIRMGIEDYVLVGHSDGGSIALIHAGSNPNSRLRGVITEAAHVFNEEICIQSVEAIRDQYEGGDLKNRLEKHHGANTDCAFYGWCDTWLHPDFRTWNVENYLANIEVPCLAIQGEDDNYGTLSQIEAISSGIKGRCETFIPPKVGHAPHADRPDLICERMTLFIKSLS